MEEILRSGLAALGLPADCVPQLLRYAALLEEKNRVMNLTAITDPAEVARLHFLDSAALLTLTDLRNKTLVDVGTGAGFPGLPIRIAEPSVRVTLLDSLLRVTRFLCLFSLVNGGLRAKDFDTVRKELVQVAAETRWHVDLRLRDAALPAPPRGRAAPRPTRARPQLQRAAQQAAAGEGRERREHGGDAVACVGNKQVAT